MPSPWIGRFDSEADFLRAREQHPKLFDVFSSIDDHLLNSRHPQNFPTLCLVCGSVETTLVNWAYVGTSPEGSVNPAWTETSVCSKCGLNSRMRALLAFILQHPDYARSARCYLAERATVSWPEFSRRFAELESSEFLGPEHRPGEKIFVPRVAALVRHEDLTRLSFADNSFDWVVTQDVFEHIPDYPAAFRECARVLRSGAGGGGVLVFWFPFFWIWGFPRAAPGPAG
ncbi:MAG: class I SAM-dependent methyltransferase, partial [Betaproteobacteria bacterium]|nr:class I SAM-dependent methyltransferase [Betaproteobacteria bacterium]